MGFDGKAGARHCRNDQCVYLFSHWKVVDVFYCESTMTLRDAFLKYADAVNVPRALVNGKPIEILERIESGRSRKRNRLSRLFSS